MTLIALTTTRKIPTILGDLLVTSGERSVPQITLPFHFKQYLSLNASGDVHPIALKQKIYVINYNLCIALGNNLWYMKQFLQDARNTFKYKEVNLANVKTFIEEQEAETLNNLDYIICGFAIVEDVKRYFVLQSETCRLQTHYEFGKCIVAGSGTKSFLEQLVIYDNLNSFGFDQTHTDLFHSISQNVYLLLSFIAKERFSLKSIEERWGAGLELIYSDALGFHKLDNTTYIYCITEINDDLSYVSNPVLIANFKYYDDLLVITSFDFATAAIFFVTPIDRGFECYDKKEINVDVSFNCESVAVCYLENITKGLIPLNNVYLRHGPKEEKKVDFSYKATEGLAGIYVSPEIEEHLKKAIKDKYGDRRTVQ